MLLLRQGEALGFGKRDGGREVSIPRPADSAMIVRSDEYEIHDPD